ncbi:SH3 domain-containing protein [Acinetobacter rathckeae]|uniref:SH3 domain-containing protein n=1 Tax=Acinetobacter rathckeae TaxID=2605272 RepID=UPI0018A2BFB8|nr:SH3 domain-containing protein [Acinetobacter rathckeae]MBF7688449.1 ligand-binding protein SH3 [Acinetobacter rathckeae]MBF7695533.1 ligand-binding protein SH3 [Acinetobacter rathckeae]
MIFNVIKKYESQYKNPIIVTRGTKVDIGLQDEQWKGWFFCKTQNNSGWIPKQIIDFQSNTEGYINKNYSAKELDADTNDIIEKIEELNGWIWGINKSTKEEGWIPLEVLQKCIENT